MTNGSTPDAIAPPPRTTSVNPQPAPDPKTVRAADQFGSLAEDVVRRGRVVRAAEWMSVSEILDANRQAGLPARTGDLELDEPVPGSAVDDELARRADAAVLAAGDAVAAAYRAVLAVQLVAARSSQEEGTTRTRARQGSLTRSLGRQSPALAHGLAGEVRYLLTRRPRTVLRSVAIGAIGGLLYLGWIRLAEWDRYERWTPYLAVLVVSVIMGGNACVNAMAFDAVRVRAALDRGARVWQLIVVKNLALAVIVLPPSLIICGLLTWQTGRWQALIPSVCVVLCLVLLWCGVGNVLSVLLPIRDVPIKQHRTEHTLREFLVAFGTAWLIGYIVTGMLIWRVLAARSISDRSGSALLAELFLLLGGLVTWILLTVLSVALVQQPEIHRRLRRQLVLSRPSIQQP